MPKSSYSNHLKRYPFGLLWNLNCFSAKIFFKVWMPQMLLTATITVESKVIVSDVVSAHWFLCSFRSSKVFRYHYYLEYKFNGSNQFIRIHLLNFMTQFPLPDYLNQVCSVVVSSRFTHLQNVKHILSSFVILVNVLHPKPSLFLYGLLVSLGVFLS